MKRNTMLRTLKERNQKGEKTIVTMKRSGMMTMPSLSDVLIIVVIMPLSLIMQVKP